MTEVFLLGCFYSSFTSLMHVESLDVNILAESKKCFVGLCRCLLTKPGHTPDRIGWNSTEPNIAIGIYQVCYLGLSQYR